MTTGDCLFDKGHLVDLLQGAAPGERGPVRGLARLLRRNPTDAERLLWSAFTNDRRFAGKGIKRQVPVGTHITDFVSFPLRLVIERGYRVLDVDASAVEADLPQALDRLAEKIAMSDR